MCIEYVILTFFLNIVLKARTILKCKVLIGEFYPLVLQSPSENGTYILNI